MIHRSRDVIPEGDIFMETLVHGLNPQEVSGRACGGGGAFPLPIDRCCVVIAVVSGSGLDTGSLGKDVIVGNGTSELKVTVGDGAIGVVKGD